MDRGLAIGAGFRGRPRGPSLLWEHLKAIADDLSSCAAPEFPFDDVVRSVWLSWISGSSVQKDTWIPFEMAPGHYQVITLLWI